MSTWILIWLFMAGISTLAVTVVMVALVRHGLSVARTAKRFQAELAPMTEQLQALSSRAGEYGSKIQAQGVRGPGKPPEG